MALGSDELTVSTAPGEGGEPAARQVCFYLCPPAADDVDCWLEGREKAATMVEEARLVAAEAASAAEAAAEAAQCAAPLVAELRVATEELLPEEIELANAAAGVLIKKRSVATNAGLGSSHPTALAQINADAKRAMAESEALTRATHGAQDPRAFSAPCSTDIAALCVCYRRSSRCRRACSRPPRMPRARWRM